MAEALFPSGFLIPSFAVLVPVILMAVRSGLLHNPLSVILFYLAVRLPLTIIMLASQLSDKTHTIQVAVPLLKCEHTVDYAQVAAGVLVSMAPVFIGFAIFQERIIKGMWCGAVKG